MKRGLIVLLLLIPTTQAEEVPPILQGVKLETRLNKPLPLDLTFRDEKGDEVRLGSLFRPGKPVILVLAYFRCPQLCNRVLSGLSDGLRDLARERGIKVGDEFDVIVVSFDPLDPPESASAKRDAMVEHYGVPGVDPKGWHFLTGHDKEIRHLTDAVGFRYRYHF